MENVFDVLMQIVPSLVLAAGVIIWAIRKEGDIEKLKLRVEENEKAIGEQSSMKDDVAQIKIHIEYMREAIDYLKKKLDS